ncbi:MAG TPA: hypothetical protein VF554_03150 [Thermoanaerobaculia bacterium]
MACTPAESARARVLSKGAFHAHQRFDADTVNRGAVLWECEWDGGVFEAGVMLGGIFRAGVFRGGVAWAVYWKGGEWTSGLWHHGFSPDGLYRPRGAFPGSAVLEASAPESPIDEGAIPRATVFAASVFGDVPRLWLACLGRALPPGEARFEIFDDSAEGSLDGGLLPGVAVLRRSPARPDFQVAYGDVLRRTATPFLAFVDTDVFWLSADVWPRVLHAFSDPRVAGVSCVSRAATESPGTFAVVMRTAVYRDVVRSVPGAFTPYVEGEAGGDAPGRWRGDDTADRVARAVKEAGFEVPLLHLEGTGAFARFDAITMTRLLGGWVGEETLLEMAVTNAYFRRGALGALALARVHDALFADGPRFGVPLSAARLWGRLLRHPRTLAAAVREAAEIRRAAGLLRRFLSRPQGAASTSA